MFRVLSGHCWLCTSCRGRSTSWIKLATSKRDVARAKALTSLDVDDGRGPAGGGRKHNLVTSGTVHWCETCGCFAESRTSKRMMDGCPGPPPASAGNGGMRQQLMSLRAGLHPVTGVRLPPAVRSTARGSGTYSRLKPGAGGLDDFVPYAPATFAPPVPSGCSAEQKRRLMRGRLLCRIGKEAARLRRQRRKDAKDEVREVIRSFISAADGDEQTTDDGVVADSSPAGENLNQQTGDQWEQALGGDNSDEEFWATLPTTDSRTMHIQGIPSRPDRSFPGKPVRSRLVIGMSCERQR